MNAGAITTTQRCYYLDLAKVIAMFLVIFAHLYSDDSSVRLYIHAFHMPLFFIISGIFHKESKVVNWKRYSITILWPTFIFIVLNVTYNLLVWGSGWNDILKNDVLGIITGNYPRVFWFLFALFWCKVFTDLYTRFPKPVLAIMLWGILLFVPILLNRRLPFILTQGLMAIPFYYLGFALKKPALQTKPSIRFLIPSILCMILTVLITRFHGRVSMYGVHLGQFAQYMGIELQEIAVPTRLCYLGVDVILFYLNGVVGSLMVIFLSLLPWPEWPAVTSLSKSLITVVGTQYFFITPITKYLGFNQPFWISCGFTIGIFFLCFVLHLALRPAYNLFSPRR